MANVSGETMRGSWMQLKGKLREAWGALTDDELDRYEGQLEQLVGYIQKTTGQERDKISSDIDRLSREVKYNF